MISKEELIERLKDLGRRFEEYYSKREWHMADIQYQRFCIVTSLLEMTGEDLKEIYDANLFQMYKTEQALERAGQKAIALDPYGIRKRA